MHLPHIYRFSQHRCRNCDRSFPIRRRLLALPIIFILILVLPARIANTSPADHIRITAVGWNVESGGSDPEVIGQRIAAFQDVDLWGLSEANARINAYVNRWYTLSQKGERDEIDTRVTRNAQRNES